MGDRLVIAAEEGPRAFTHTSRVFVWSLQGINVAVHMVPPELSDNDLDLGTVTRVAYHILESVEGGLDVNECFVVLHYVTSTQNIHVTMLPGGNAEKCAHFDTKLKEGKDGFSDLLGCVKHTILSGVRPNGVYMLFNDPHDLDGGEIVHEIGVDVLSEDAILEPFLNATGSRGRGSVQVPAKDQHRCVWALLQI